MSKNYLVARGGGPHFRIRIPEELWGLFGRREIRRSLAALSARQARAEALVMANRALEFFQWIRMSQQNYTSEELKKIVDRWLNRQLRQQVTNHRLARRAGRKPPEPGLADPERLEALSLAVGDDIDQIRHGTPQQAREAYDHWAPFAADLAADMGIEFADLTATEQERLTLFTMAAESRRYGQLSQHSPDFASDFWEEAAEESTPASTQKPPKAQSPTLAEAWENCVAHYRDKGRKDWMVDETTPGGQARPKKNRQANWVKQDLEELWGLDLPISEITWQRLEELRRCFQSKYPANRRKLKKYKDMSLRQLADGPDIPVAERIKGSTKDVRFRISRDFFKFLRAHPDYRDHFPHDADAVLQVASDPIKTYRHWPLDEVRQILESPQLHGLFLQRDHTRHPAGMFWLVTLLLYTGGRQKEIMGLRPEDLELDREHPVIQIRLHEHRPGVKTIESERWVPIHRDLLALGLADWLEFRRGAKAKTLWPVEGKGPDYWGRMFREKVTKPLGLYQRNTKVMHSLRGTFDSMASAVMPDAPRRLMTGHKGSGTDYRHYLQQMENHLPQYSEFINKLDFGLDLKRLEERWRASIGPG